MSNFTGVTFAKQKVTPSYDAIIRRALLSDGTLTGCGMSYSGSTLTMAAGQLMVCGRQIIHPASQNWAVTGQTSGFARLVLTIDLTRTSTKDTFDQVQDSIQYATDADGFVELEQTDINTTGTKYQVAVCVVSLGPGGITGIVSQLERSEGGAGVNFKVVGDTTAPGSPTENMIWVNTPVPITSWAFTSTAPETPAEGMVWFSTGQSSGVAFNALRKNTITVCPLAAKQYVEGQWVAQEAKSFQGGEWVEWVTYYYNSGDECTGVTGGWEAKAFRPYATAVNTRRAGAPTVTKGDTSITMVGKAMVWDSTISANARHAGALFTTEAVELSGADTLHLNVDSFDFGGASQDWVGCFFGATAEAKDYYTPAAQVKVEEAGTVALDVSALTGPHYLYVALCYPGATAPTIIFSEISS